MFDRYAGENSTKLSPADKMYRTKEGFLYLPSINIMSLLTAQNGRSAASVFFGKNGSTIASGIAAFLDIVPTQIPLLGEDDEPIRFDGWNDQIRVENHVARIKKGRATIPNPQSRPVIGLPWSLKFVFHYVDNKQCPVNTLQQALTEAGILGLGSYRPFFGTYTLTEWERIS
jgi:hypothetical protein